MAIGANALPFAGKAYAAAESAVHPEESASYSYKTTAEKTDEKTGGGYKVIRRRNGTLDLSFAYNAKPAVMSEAGEDEHGSDDAAEDTGAAASASSSTDETEEKSQQTQADHGQNDLEETQQTPETSAQPATAQTAVRQSSVPKCVRQIIRFNTDVDDTPDYEAISKAYEPSNHGKYLTRTVSEQRPADESLAEFSDPDLQVNVVNLSK